MKINGLIVMLALASLTTTACTEEIAPPAEGMPAEGQKVTFCISADFPDISPDSKVALDDAGVLSWTGEESATLIFGQSGANNSNNPTLPSVSPGVFSGEVTIPDGMTIDDIKGIVIPAENGANFKGDNSGSAVTRIRMYVDAAQTGDTPPMDQCPFFSELTSSQLTNSDGTYTLPGITLKSAADLIKMNVYGKHPDMEDDEILKSIRLDNGNSQYLTSTVEYKINNGGWSVNKGNGGTYVKVTLSEESTIADKKAEDGITAWAAITLYGVRSVNKITITTDKAVYTKEVAKDLEKTLFTTLKVYPVGLNLANGYTRDALVKYSTDGGQTWLESLPETYSTLAVKTVSSANLSAAVLSNIKNSIAAQDSPVALDLRQATYESTVFPAVFNGTESSKSTLLKSISFPSNVKEVAANAFEYCSTLESVDLNGITTINTKSFHWAGLKTLNVPHTVTSFPGYLSFGCCHQLTDIYYDSPAPLNGSVNQAQFAWAIMTKSTALPTAYGNAAYPELFPSEGGSCKITFGPNVKHIARNMFKYNKGIAEAVFYCAPVINIAGFFELNNIHTFDFSLVSEVASGNNTSTSYMKNIGNLAKDAGKTRRILVPAGCTDTYKNAQPFKYMVNTLGWTIVEQGAGDIAATDVRIGTYNVRYYNGDTSSATNKWEVRKERLVQSIKDIDFDIFGVQEAMDPQIASLEEMLGDVYGTAYFRPQTGASSDSSVGIFYKKNDWILTNVKNFWISSTPDEKSKGDTGVKGNYYRGAICGTLINKTTNARLFFMDSHGCLNPEPNETYAQVYLDKEAALNPDGLPSFFVGDLNTKPETNSSILFRTHWNDTFMSIDESLRQGCEYTYNGFKNIDGTSRIDYVYYRGENVTPTLYKCDNTLYNDLYPSDHWPVFADFTITPVTETE